MVKRRTPSCLLSPTPAVRPRAKSWQRKVDNDPVEGSRPFPLMNWLRTRDKGHASLARVLAYSMALGKWLPKPS